MEFDLIIRNARLRSSPGSLHDLAIRSDRIARIAPSIPGEAGHVIDAHGGLVTESFVNGHLHLCKVYTLGMIGDAALASYTAGGMGGAMTAIEQAAKVKERYDESWIIGNVRKALDLAVKYGNTHIRAFADTDTKARLEGVKALLKAREEYRDRVTVQVVAFPQDGVLRDPGAEDYVRQALELGADVVGGIPWIEYSDDGAREHIDRMFALAKEYNKDVSMLIDDAGDPGLRTLEMLARKTIKEHWQGRVTCQHARAMALYPEPYYRKIEHLLLEGGIGLVSDPHTGPLYARVGDLYAARVAVALGQDDIADAYYPFGRNNMLEVAFLAAHLMWKTSFEDLRMLYDLITTNAARALNMQDYGLAEGNVADLVTLEAGNEWEAIWGHEKPVHVIKSGKEITAPAPVLARH